MQTTTKPNPIKAVNASNLLPICVPDVDDFQLILAHSWDRVKWRHGDVWYDVMTV